MKRFEGIIPLALGLLLVACAQITPGTSFRDCAECPEMVVIPSGSFMMGSTDTESDRTTRGSRHRLMREKPVHRVTLGQLFAIGKYKVERKEFAAFVAETGYHSAGSCDYWTGRYYDTGKTWRDSYRPAGTTRNPVRCVSWYGAKAYVAWLSQKTGKEYRLPSESEWEYVRRGFVDTLREGKPVSNRFQVFDMSGVAGEWIEDCWHETYSAAPRDGSAWSPKSAETCFRRVVRGAIWYYGKDFRRPTTRSRYKPGLMNVDIGFRVARTL